MADQAVITPAAQHRALRAQALRDEFEHAVAIIIQPAHQPCIARPGDAAGLQAGLQPFEELAGLCREIIVDLRRVRHQCGVASILAVEDAQRVGVQPALAVFAQIATMGSEIGGNGGAPCSACFRIAHRIEGQFHVARHAQFFQQMLAQCDHLHVRCRLACTQDFGVELVKLAEPALLRAFITEQWAPCGQLQRRQLLPAIFDVGARDAGGEFRAQAHGIAAAILEFIHFLGNHVGGLTQRPRKHGGRFEHRHFHPAEAVQIAHAVERFDHMIEAGGGLADHVLRAPRFLGRFLGCLAHGRANRAAPGCAQRPPSLPRRASLTSGHAHIAPPRFRPHCCSGACPTLHAAATADRGCGAGGKGCALPRHAAPACGYHRYAAWRVQG